MDLAPVKYSKGTTLSLSQNPGWAAPSFHLWQLVHLRLGVSDICPSNLPPRSLIDDRTLSCPRFLPRFFELDVCTIRLRPHVAFLWTSLCIPFALPAPYFFRIFRSYYSKEDTFLERDSTAALITSSPCTCETWSIVFFHLYRLSTPPI